MSIVLQAAVMIRVRHTAVIWVDSHYVNSIVMIQLWMVFLSFFVFTLSLDKHQMTFFLYIWWCWSSTIFGR